MQAATYIINKTDMYPISELDHRIGHTIGQIVFFILVVLYTGLLNIRMIHIVIKNEYLHISSNWIMCFILLCDIFIVLQYSICAILLTSRSLWLSEAGARFISSLSMVSTGIQRFLLALASVEKLFYFKFVYKHVDLFTQRKTFRYIIIISIFCVISGILSCLPTKVQFIPDLMMCVLCYGSFKEATILSKISIVFRLATECVVIIFSLLLQVDIFIFSWNVAKTDLVFQRKNRIWKRMILNFISLFFVTLLILFGAIFLKLSFRLTFPVFRRLCVFVYIFGAPLVNPLIALFGNPPLRRAFMKKKKKFVTDFCAKTDNAPQTPPLPSIS